MATMPFPLVSISGSPLERGRQYGRQATDRIRRSVALYSGRLGKIGASERDLADMVGGYIPLIEAFDPAFIEEMKGIAEGAGLPFEQIVLINARTEVLAKARRRPAAQAEHSGEGCTGVVVLPERSASGELIHAQNWDWMAECAETAIVLRVRPDRGPSYQTFTEAGGLARSGMNDCGIAITANYLESDRDFNQDGVPLSLIRRMVLQQEHMAMAMRAVAATRKSASNNIIVSHKDGFGVSFECAPDEAFNIYPENDLIVHANHWQSPTALLKLREQAHGSWSDSFYRDWRVRRELEKSDKIGVPEVKKALADTFGHPYSVCRPPHLSSRGHVSATVATIVMRPASGEMELAVLPAENPEFTSYPAHAAGMAAE
ncbi:acyl-coenzyme A:6-aminopenicillanic acid acyl-transferase family protein (plasmid) [Rhizobium etli bv. phaseoli str. IE4803]|uniref:Acyl-coenzyme A:6-aminopenicillanic acid acyl-transferase family protein n=1 Tax=Rhizobium etli bv. mimosae str. IE4771 TaxID=1432050 RepID=A0A060IHS4_RHIET|nr:C45 family peptidase [Rhizobium sp. IE4771]AIC31116.1 acyl-coenzyme A:6-aminopenicillanic acid acyl-transferase family protein [Rhizobium sp. IE4771]AJC83095.1 acyl-coenzyme A:6-aminopenicillanic acid acyl-transferase family protein [Rhizobium etli bv. phaseoli str. IE4803]